MSTRYLVDKFLVNFSNLESNLSYLTREREIRPPGSEESKVQPLVVVLAEEAERKKSVISVRLNIKLRNNGV